MPPGNLNTPDENEAATGTATDTKAKTDATAKDAKAKPEPEKRTLLGALRAGETLWSLRFKGIRGVQEVLIMASDNVKAEAVGRAWVNAQPGRVYLSVAPTVVADESILATVTNPEAVGAAGPWKR